MGEANAWAGVNLFSYGWLTPVAAFIFSVAGCLLGIVLTTKAAGLAGGARVRVLAYAAVAIAITGVWQPQIIGLIGLDVPASAVRFDLWPLAASLGLALAGAGPAVFLIGRKRPGRWHAVGAGALVAAGIGGAHVFGTIAIRFRSQIARDPLFEALAGSGAVLAGMILVWLVVRVNGLRRSLAGAVGLALAVCGSQYAGLYALHLNAVPPFSSRGISPMLLVSLVAISAVIGIMLWYFTVGASTIGDLRAIFTPAARPVEIEPWMIREVSARIAVGITPVTEAGPDEFASAAGPIIGNGSRRNGSGRGWLRRRLGGGKNPARGPALDQSAGNGRQRAITPVWRTVPVWRNANTSEAALNLWRAPGWEAVPQPVGVSEPPAAGWPELQWSAANAVEGSPGPRVALPGPGPAPAWAEQVSADVVAVRANATRTGAPAFTAPPDRNARRL